jgi:threonine aldolase
MLRSILTARLGDDSRDGDPTARELEAISAEMLGREAALLTVSGTASNLLAMRSQAEPGGAAIVEESAHIYGAELGGVTAACGLLVLTVPGSLGAMDPDRLKFVTYRNISRQDIEKAVTIVGLTVAERPWISTDQ